MASTTDLVPVHHCSCGEKVLAVGLTASELYDTVADELQEPASPPRSSGPAAAPPAAAAAKAQSLPLRPLAPARRSTSSLGDLQQMAALMALQQEPSQQSWERSLEPATPLTSERHHGAATTHPSQSGRAGSTGSAGSDTMGGQQAQRGSPRCSLSGSSAFRFESVNRVAAVAGKEYTHRRSGERQRRSREKERRCSEEQPSAATVGGAAAGGAEAAASPARLISPQRHSRLSSMPRRASQPAWQPPPVRFGAGTAAQRLADVPLLPAEPQLAAEYDSSGVAAWLAESAVAAGGAPQLIGPDAVLQSKAPAASRGQTIAGKAAKAPSPQPGVSSPATRASQLAAAAEAAAPLTEPEGTRAFTPLSIGGSHAKASPAAPSSPVAHTAAVAEAAAPLGGSGTGLATAYPSSKAGATASCCSSDGEGQARCAALRALAFLGRLLRF